MFTFQDVHTVRLKLRKPESKKKVQWQSGTVDNENMNKKKSKCEQLLYIFMLDYMQCCEVSLSEDASLLGCDAVLLGEGFDVSAGFSAFCWGQAAQEECFTLKMKTL
jgi:hypothetical protein